MPKYNSLAQSAEPDVLMNMDSQRATLLVLLDLSAAFDTVDHDVLINRLGLIVISGSALQWFKSYLKHSLFLMTKISQRH